MKVLFAGQFKEWSIEHHYTKYLSPFAEVFTYPAEDIFDEYYHPSIWNKVKYKLGVSRINEKIGKGLIEKAKAVKPDIIWVFKGMRISPKTLEELRRMNIKLVNYNPDHPFFFSSKGSGNANVTASIGLFDLHFIYDKRVGERLEKEYGIPTAMLPFGFELQPSVFDKIKNVPEKNTACFIGTCDKIRVENVMLVAAAGIPVHVFGSNWGKMLPRNTKNIIVHPPVYGEEFWLNMRKYRLQLNIFRPHNIGSHNMRTFEVPAVGGIMLAPDSPDHQLFFEANNEIFTYTSKKEMIAKTREILAMSKDDINAIRTNARRRSVESNYSYEWRAKQAFDAMSKL